ncbi:hypothetical protein [Tenacibaculum maritimum]|uniref:hypothetical protein n=1 Tax=Tenacibaculum maritimum TaxID=107401 RepID=UPI0012E64E76|nr:hypothetical protein [Tenacibaculum maritimum]CAA0208159.1 conserved exported hypothetical protein [Tenacibaculum maritimum]
MKKIVILLLLVISMGCHCPRYTHSGSVNGRLDFREGRWLLNTIEAPSRIEDVLTKIADKEFTNLIGNRFSILERAKGILMPSEVDGFSKSVLRDIKRGTGVDFLIHIKAENIASEIGAFQIGGVDTPVRNTGKVHLTIYDLNLLEEFYTHTIIGNLMILKDSQDFAFAKNTNAIIRKGLKRIIKKIKKNKIRR